MATQTLQPDSVRENHRPDDTNSDQWLVALAYYRAKRTASDAIDIDAPGGDEAIDAYCVAMDHLIEEIPAPDLPAAVLKFELMKERFEGMEYPRSTVTAIIADLKRLAASGSSLILQLHQRFERIWEASNRLDDAQPAKADPNDLERFRLYHSCERAMEELAQESILVERLLLRQVPGTDEEATVQMLHARGLYDCGDGLNDDDRRAIEVALANITDYFIGEGRADMEVLGKQFSKAAMLCGSERRHREGLTVHGD